MAALVAFPMAAATPSSLPIPFLTRRNRTALRGEGTLEGCADQRVLADASIRELGFPGAGHWSLLRSRGESGGLKMCRILLRTPQESQGEISKLSDAMNFPSPYLGVNQ